MFTLIFSDSDGRFMGYHDGEVTHAVGRALVVEALPADLSALFIDDNDVLFNDASQWMTLEKDKAIAGIKKQAAQLISALAWKLERAQEQEQAGWKTLQDVDDVLAEREQIRQSSNAAEDAVLALTDLASVQTFVWSVDVVVAAPRRVTPGEFLNLFTATEVESIIAAADANASLRVWFEKFKVARFIQLNNPETIAGVNALEIATILGSGRAAEILGE